ncbi:hypothetical protein [Xanthomonas pisi]|nr:hypothetical protein [Xanthomonas pisi]
MRILLGTVSAIFGAGMLAMAPTSSAPLGFYAFGVFCLLITAACLLTGRAQGAVGKVLGLALFASSSWYLIDQVMSGPLLSGSRSDPSIVNAAMLMMFVGLPGLAFAVRRKRSGHASEP